MLIVDETVREIPGRSRFDFFANLHTVRAHVSHALMVVRYVAHAAIRENVTGRYCNIKNLPV